MRSSMDAWLVLWRQDRPVVELRFDHALPVRYRAKQGRFDLLTDGAFGAMVAGPDPDRSLVIALGEAFDAGANAEALPRLGSRFQFKDRTLERLAHSLETERRRAPAASEPIGTLLAALAGRLVELESGVDGDPLRLAPGARDRVERAIDARLDRPPDATALAALVGLGSTEFLRRFKNSFARTLHQYVLDRRIAHAQLRLASTAQSVTRMALELGFASHAHFTSTFHRRTGLSPSDYRRREGRH